MSTIPAGTAFRIPGIPGLLLASMLVGTAGADVMELNDGRRFEGKVLSEDGGKVRMDARVGSVRATVGFDRSEIKNMERKDLPPGFFDPPPAAARVSDPGRFRPDQPLYLEVPIIGVFGKDVVAEGVRSVLSYAKAHRIPHIVLSIDSSGGDIDEAREIYRLLQASEKHFKYHSLVRKCRGDALAVAVWSDTLHILPGGVLGGGIEDVSPGKKGKAAVEEDAEEKEVLWARIAHKVVTETERTGRQAEIVRALLDPGIRFAAWRDKDGVARTGAEPPPGVELLVASGEGKTLEITHDQAIAFGMPEFKGEARDLGAALKLDGWTAESDHGLKVMNDAAAAARKRTDQAQASYEAKAAKNISRREETDRYIENALKEAATWDPTKGSYETYSQHWNWGWGWSGGSSAVEWTDESQKKWRTRTDATLHYLQQAAKGLRTMKKLDAEAVKLKLDPTFKPGEIDIMLKDMEVRFAALQAHRTRTGE